ncbi:phytoene desaturase family protein [Lentzea cavernae]|uniref:Pyridine nucleotide-disulfide oxidoreductase domain-containing protein 2 n=1 Tax=Lentzea cavernae TaxID=2020703 RepID=A0ABQ3MH30_9PSEU|nr:NAD(P)/FAD-dependent oxidoreductase [Lentzea cavernae]GHH43775.1 putative dehydrogenase [Lentzea cavernae]
MPKAVVVGSGPNGLAAAVRLAQYGIDVTVLEAADRLGGGARTTEKLVAGTLHDECSAVHPTAVLSPYLRELRLDRYGLRWRHPEVMLAHPLDDGTCGVLRRSVDETAAGLPAGDGQRWRQAYGPLAANLEATASDLLGPLLRWPSHPVHTARFGLRAVPPAALTRLLWRSPVTQSLFLGVAAHVMHDLRAPMSSSVAAMLISAGHRFGWPVAEGGSQAITDALAALLRDLGGKTVTGTRIKRSSELPDADVVVLDTSPSAAARIFEGHLPGRVHRAYRRWRHGPAAFKVDFAVRGDVPWSNADCGVAGTVHLGGDPDEVIRTARDVRRGRMPDAPFVLVGQQYLADPSRSAGDVHPIWAYAHVPHGYNGDATAAIVDQIERFAPGFKDKIVAFSAKKPADLMRGNENYVGGNILTGANDPFQLVFRPRLTPHPYDTGIPGVYLCSAATPPGAGVHGMSGYHAAGRALRHLGLAPAVQ